MPERENFTQKKIMSMVRSALRKVWTATTKSDFIRNIRKPYVGPGSYKWGVTCRNPECRKVMGLSQRERIQLVRGNFSKKPKLVYQIDHIDGIHPFTKWEDLGKFADDLFNGKLRVLCYQCHAEHTKTQTQRRAK